MTSTSQPTGSNPFSLTRMVMATVRHRPVVTIALALGIAIATTVITGALLVGDSMRGSLRALTMERLGRIDSVLSPGQFFPIANLLEDDSDTHPIILFPGSTLERPASGDGPLLRIGGAQMVGIDDAFWDLNIEPWRPQRPLDDQSVILNQSAATELQVAIGDEVTLRLPDEGAVPADSP
ncbi:MAG: ABC transporter permease, partial [Planctomycetota bacterium]